MSRLRDLVNRSSVPRHEMVNRDRGSRARAHLARARERERRALTRRGRERDRSRRLGGAADPRPRIQRAAFVGLSVSVGLGLAALLGEGAIRWLGPDLGAVDTIAVQGQDRLTSTQIAGATGVARGTSLSTVDPALVEARLAAVPWIEHADVMRLPPATLLVRVRERQPRAVLVPDAPGQPQRLVDAGGTPFIGAPIAEELPLIVGGDDLPSGERHALLVSALDVLASLDDAGARALVDARGRLALHLPDGNAPEGWVVRGSAEVVLGRDRLDDRLGRLAELLRADVLARNDTSRPLERIRIDLRFADQAVLSEAKPRERG